MILHFVWYCIKSQKHYRFLNKSLNKKDLFCFRLKPQATRWQCCISKVNFFAHMHYSGVLPKIVFFFYCNALLTVTHYIIIN